MGPMGEGPLCVTSFIDAHTYPEFNFIFFFFGLHGHVLLLHLLHLLLVDLQAEGQRDHGLRVSLEPRGHVLLKVLQKQGLVKPGFVTRIFFINLVASDKITANRGSDSSLGNEATSRVLISKMSRATIS